VTSVKKRLLVLGMLLPAAYVLAETYTYDDLGRVKTVTNGTLVTTYSYDSADNRTSVQTAAPNTNHAPVCTNQTTTMTGIPPIATATVTITEAMVLARCTDPDGDAMTVLTPAVPYTFTINAGQTRTTPFSVSDGRGGTGSGTITFIRP
jgi:YD repeat-containing protein